MLSPFKKIRWSALRSAQFRKYISYAIGEIVLVVVGILIAVSINGRIQSSKEKKIEQHYYREMQLDFEENHRQAQAVISHYKTLIPRLILLLEQSALDSVTLPVDSLNTFYGEVEIMPTYSSMDRVYNTIMGSGDLKLIKDQKLKSLLAEYYESLHMLNLVQETHELQLVNSIQPYTIKNLDFQAILYEPFDEYDLAPPVDSDRILEVIHQREFRNVVTLKWQISMDLWTQVESIQEINKDILKALDSRLEE
ncbi:MAG: hypothetical protein SchgKO_16400 [Schleiferiaceae bacterium]